MLLRALLDLGCEVRFFSKASFVDPRGAVGDRAGFRFTDVDNRISDRLRARTARIPLVGLATTRLDVARYNQMLVAAIDRAHLQSPFDVCVWLGDYARGRVPGLASVSFAQGPPGTDARSIFRRFSEVSRLSGSAAAWKWRILAMVRLSRWGLPRFSLCDAIVVGSSQSRRTLHNVFGIAESRTTSLPYPIDLETFRPSAPRIVGGRMKCLWLGRIVPRKRLDLFLDGIAAAIRGGADLEATIVGSVGFVQGYEKLIAAFPFQDRLKWIPSIPRGEVPDMLREHDVLIQPSEEEDFGSSVAEAQACGIPVIVGQTNGNADYLSPMDVCLKSDSPAELAEVLCAMAVREKHSPETSRAFAEKFYEKNAVATKFVEVLAGAARNRNAAAT